MLFGVWVGFVCVLVYFFLNRFDRLLGRFMLLSWLFRFLGFCSILVVLVIFVGLILFILGRSLFLLVMVCMVCFNMLFLFILFSFFIVLVICFCIFKSLFSLDIFIFVFVVMCFLWLVCSMLGLVCFFFVIELISVI